MSEKTQAAAAFNADQLFKDFQDLYALNLATATKLFDQHKALTSVLVETGTKQMEMLRNVESYPAIIEKQKDLAAEYRDKVSEIARETVSIVFDGTNQYSQWASARVADFQATAQKAA